LLEFLEETGGIEKMINKLFNSVDEALHDLQGGATIMIGGFLGAGTPFNLVQGMVDKGVKGLTLICNSQNNLNPIVKDGRQIKKVIMSAAVSPYSWAANPLKEGIQSGQIDVELVPQGTLAERIRAGGAGIPAFYTPTGVGTLMEKGKQKATFDGKEYVLEMALRADYAFIGAYKADSKGNLVYRKSMRNFNVVMATAARCTVAEVGEIVEPGELDPETIATPGIFVDRVVMVPPRKVIDFKERQKKQMGIRPDAFRRA
jgi:3-oxoacid CoA-transferase A subunit